MLNNHPEPADLMNTLGTCTSKAKELQASNVEATQVFYEPYEKNFKNVSLQLEKKWGKLFRVEPYKKFWLCITPRRPDDITDEDWSALSKDLITVLQANKFFDLKGLCLKFDNCDKLTDKSLSDFANAIFDSPLALHHLALYFESCNKFTDKSFSDLARTINSLPLQSLALSFTCCKELTDKSLSDLANAISTPSLHPQPLSTPSLHPQPLSTHSPHLQSLTLHFYSIANFSQSAKDVLKKAIEASQPDITKENLIINFLD